MTVWMILGIIAAIPLALMGPILIAAVLSILWDKFRGVSTPTEQWDLAYLTPPTPMGTVAAQLRRRPQYGDAIRWRLRDDGRIEAIGLELDETKTCADDYRRATIRKLPSWFGDN